jgi:hypothetical protein
VKQTIILGLFRVGINLLGRTRKFVSFTKKNLEDSPSWTFVPLVSPLDLVIDIFHNSLHRGGERLASAGAFQLTHSFCQFVYFGSNRSQSFG